MTGTRPASARSSASASCQPRLRPSRASEYGARAARSASGAAGAEQRARPAVQHRLGRGDADDEVGLDELSCDRGLGVRPAVAEQ